MRQFLITEWPFSSFPLPKETKAYPLIKELYDYHKREPIYVLDVEGKRMYFYPNEVKEVTNEGD